MVRTKEVVSRRKAGKDYFKRSRAAGAHDRAFDRANVRQGVPEPRFSATPPPRPAFCANGG